MKVLVTGGAGFIGTSVVRQLLGEGESVVNLDKLTYAGSNPAAGRARRRRTLRARGRRHRRRRCARADLRTASPRRRHAPRRRDSCRPLDRRARRVRPHQSARHLHVCSRRRASIGRRCPPRRRARFRFHHVSTDEVYRLARCKATRPRGASYRPNSPYAASQGGCRSSRARLASHLWASRCVTTNCSNNYGPWQFPEKLIPLDDPQRASRARRCRSTARASNVRDWLYVATTPRRCRCVLRAGELGETYNIAGGEERANIELVRLLCAILDEELPHSPHRPHETPHRLRRRPSGTRSALRRRRRQARGCELRLASAREPRDRPAQDGALVSRQSRLVGAHPQRRLSRRAAGRADCCAEARREGHHPGRRLGHAALSADARGVEAAPADLRQADDLLPAVDADAGRDPRHPGHHHARRRAAFRARSWATAANGASRSPTPCSRTPDGLAQAFLIGRDFVAGEPGGARARRQSLLRRRAVAR